METKICKQCGRELPIDHFRKTRWGGYYTNCNDCVRVKAQETKKENAEVIKKSKLADFTPRQLMEELARRGYEGKIQGQIEGLSDEEKYQQGWHDALEKQGEQKPWSEEDMSKVQRICEYLDEAKKYYADITEVRDYIEWLKSLEQRIGG